MHIIKFLVRIWEYCISGIQSTMVSNITRIWTLLLYNDCAFKSFSFHYFKSLDASQI